jgi:hypothetical protein
MNNSIAVTFTYKREDYIRAIRRHYMRTLQLRRDIIAGILSLLFGLYLTFIAQVSWLGWLVMIVGSILLAMIGYALCLLPMLVYRSQPKLKDEYSLHFSESGIDFKTDQIDSKLQWSLYNSWWSDADFYILYYGKRDLTVIPRGALDVFTDQRLQNLLLTQLGKPKS